LFDLSPNIPNVRIPDPRIPDPDLRIPDPDLRIPDPDSEVTMSRSSSFKDSE
jgi:hypothetical protein